MRYTTRNAHLAIRAKKTFKTSGALRGVNTNPTLYQVFSYKTEIARWEKYRGWTVNEEYYSPTTSRHQRQVRRALQEEDTLQREDRP